MAHDASEEVGSTPLYLSGLEEVPPPSAPHFGSAKWDGHVVIGVRGR